MSKDESTQETPDATMTQTCAAAPLDVSASHSDLPTKADDDLEKPHKSLSVDTTTKDTSNTSNTDADSNTTPVCAKQKTGEPNEADDTGMTKPWDILWAIKSAYSTALLVFSVITVVALICTRQTKISHDIHPAVALVVVCVCLMWINMAEGAQGAFVGLQPINKDLYRDSHPITHKCTTLCHEGDNLKRFIVGRQLIIVLIVFVTNLCAAPIDSSATVLGLPTIVSQIFLGSGLVTILMTVMAGQLNAQVNAIRSMLDYINNYFAMFTLYAALAIEFSGLLHTCHLVQLIATWASGKSNDSPRTATQAIFFWARVLLSLAILAFSFAVTLTGLANGQTTMWDGVPTTVSIVLFFVFMTLVGILEGMQVAFFALAKLPKHERGDNAMTLKICDLLFGGDGDNHPRFMIGRQVCVTMCFFILARFTTLNVEVGVDDNIFGVSDILQQFFNTGLLGALITTIVASIVWQLIASAFPVAFISNRLVYAFLCICLALESTGICSGARVLAAIHRRLAGFEFDDVYLVPDMPALDIAKLETAPTMQSPIKDPELDIEWQ